MNPAVERMSAAQRRAKLRDLLVGRGWVRGDATAFVGTLADGVVVHEVEFHLREEDALRGKAPPLPAADLVAHYSAPPHFGAAAPPPGGPALPAPPAPPPSAPVAWVVAAVVAGAASGAAILWALRREQS